MKWQEYRFTDFDWSFECWFRFFTWGQATVEMRHFLFQPDLGTGSLISVEQPVASRPALAQRSVPAGQNDFFCSAYCQHIRHTAVGCVRLSLQERVTKRYTETSKVYWEQQRGREDFLSFRARPSIIWIHRIFSTKLLSAEKSNILIQYSIMSLGCLLNLIDFRWLERTKKIKN